MEGTLGGGRGEGGNPGGGGVVMKGTLGRGEAGEPWGGGRQENPVGRSGRRGTYQYHTFSSAAYNT
jgi:hypothetical protein